MKLRSPMECFGSSSSRGYTNSDSARRAVLRVSGPSKSLGKFDVAAKRIRKLHLARGLALGLKKSGAGDENARAHCPRCRDVQPIKIVQELHPVRRILWH